MSKVKFEDFSDDVVKKLERCELAFLEEAGALVESGAKDRVRLDTGWTKKNYDHKVVESDRCCYVGSNEQNAIWEEFGTGIYAEGGDGRKDVPWHYIDEDGKWHSTKGKTPRRPLRGAYEKARPAIKKRAREIFKKMD